MFRIIFTLLVMSLMSNSPAFSAEPENQVGYGAEELQVAPVVEPTTDVKTEDVAPVEVGNKICPISGEKVGQMGDVVKVEYNGKFYNLCCLACKKDFNKDPEKYSKKAEEEAAQSKTEEAK
jgi:YHS domain-containing protein